MSELYLSIGSIMITPISNESISDDYLGNVEFVFGIAEMFNINLFCKIKIISSVSVNHKFKE
jgi:hypothetical protein